MQKKEKNKMEVMYDELKKYNYTDDDINTIRQGVNAISVPIGLTNKLEPKSIDEAKEILKKWLDVMSEWKASLGFLIGTLKMLEVQMSKKRDGE